MARGMIWAWHVYIFLNKKTKKNHKMTRGGYCSHSLTILTVLAKRTKLKKNTNIRAKLKKKNKSRTTLKKPNEN